MSESTTGVGNRVDPAPAGVLRAAAWPIETLASFGSGPLARLALEAGDLSGRMLDESFIDLWRETMERERQRLWSLTADEPRFMKALLFSNPRLRHRVQRSASRRGDPPTKTLRKLEFTLYRYLARAVGRTTPMGLWAGVSMLLLGSENQQRPTAPRYALAPDLRPFQMLLRKLATREPYRSTAIRNLNPTLQASTHGGWEFWARRPSGEIERRRIDHDPSVAAIIDALSSGRRGTLTELSRYVLQATVRQERRWNGGEAAPGAQTLRGCNEGTTWDLEGVRGVLAKLADGGALVGGLDLSCRFETAWEALEGAEAQLSTNDRCHWREARTSLHEICAALADDFDEMTIERMDELLSAAGGEVQRLADALGVAMPAMEYPIVHCDLGLPFEVCIDAAQRHRLVATAEEYEQHWICGASPWTAWRLARHAQRLRRLSAGERLGSVDVGAEGTSGGGADGASAELRARLDAWERTVTAHADEVVLDSTAGGDHLGPPNGCSDHAVSSPLACLYVGLQDGFALDVHGLSDDPATPFARFATALGSTEVLTTWLSRRLRRLEAEHAIELAELVAPFEPNPNALARPMLDCPLVDPWSASSVPAGETLIGAEFRLDADTRLPLLSLRCGARPMAVFSFASAHFAATDPVACQLLQTTFHAPTSGNFRPLGAALPTEIETPRYAPRIRLPGGAVIRRRRTVIDGAKLRQLAVRSPWQRYVHWQHLAAEHGWPELLNVSLSGRAALPMKCSSPLALEALFRGMPDRGPEDYLVVEELPPSPWLKDAAGRRYVADLALPCARRVHGWSARRAVSERAATETR